MGDDIQPLGLEGNTNSLRNSVITRSKRTKKGQAYLLVFSLFNTSREDAFDDVLQPGIYFFRFGTLLLFGSKLDVSVDRLGWNCS